MLIKINVLRKIKTGEVSMAFRKWKKPKVKQGGTLKTPIDLLSIDEISIVDKVTERELGQAGYSDRSELENDLSKSSGEEIYRIKFHLAGADPRISLRNDDNLTAEEFEKIKSKLTRFDKSERSPGWAHKVLVTIRNNPGKSSGLISESLDIEKMGLKSNIRKLKELGLTMSLEVGYKISPRGQAYLKLRKTNPS